MSYDNKLILRGVFKSSIKELNKDDLKYINNFFNRSEIRKELNKNDKLKSALLDIFGVVAIFIINLLIAIFSNSYLNHHVNETNLLNAIVKFLLVVSILFMMFQLACLLVDFIISGFDTDNYMPFSKIFIISQIKKYFNLHNEIKFYHKKELEYILKMEQDRFVNIMNRVYYDLPNEKFALLHDLIIEVKQRNARYYQITLNPEVLDFEPTNHTNEEILIDTLNLIAEDKKLNYEQCKKKFDTIKEITQLDEHQHKLKKSTENADEQKALIDKLSQNIDFNEFQKKQYNLIKR